MDKLITILNQEGKLVVSSREVAGNFEKEHKDVLETIRNLIAENSAVKNIVIESKYVNSRGREYPEYLLTRDGFSLLVMGFTGQKALEWKLKYIQAFNKMEQELVQVKKLSPMEQLKLQYEVLDEHEERLSNLENNMTVDFRQQRLLQNKARSKAIEVLGGAESQAYKDNSVRGKAFSAIWRDYKDYFMIASYRDTPRIDFNKSMEYLGSWQAQGKLLREIEEHNSQLREVI